MLINKLFKAILDNILYIPFIFLANFMLISKLGTAPTLTPV